MGICMQKFKSVRNDCSSLKYDLFRCNIIKDWRFVCGYIREDSSHFLLNCHLYIEQRTVLFHFLHHHNFWRDIRALLFGDSQKDLAQNMLLSKAVQTFNKNSRWFIEGTYLPHSILLNCYHFFLHDKSLNTIIIRMLSVRPMFVWYWRELHISCKTCVQSYCIYLTIKYA